LSIKFENSNLSFSKRVIKFYGQVAGGEDTVICSIDRTSLLSFAGLLEPFDEVQLTRLFHANSETIHSIAASQWRAGINHPTITHEDLTAYPFVREQPLG